MNQQNNNQPEVPPRRSMRLATIIPASHWISIGYSQDDAQAMEKIQNDMQKYCDGGNETGLLLQEDIVLGQFDQILPHHDMMLPHWQKFANGLRGRTSVNELRIKGISLPISVLDIILQASMHNLINLTLYRTGLGNEGFLRLSYFLNENTRLQKLGIGSGMDEIDISVASSLSDAISSHQTLERVSFVECGLNNSAVLRIILEGCKRLIRMFLANNGLRSEAVVIISEFISRNYPTQMIMLDQNNISNNDTLLLASALSKNTHLKELNLQDNDDITEEGEKTLLNALFDPTSMDSVLESNHTCMAYTSDVNDTMTINQRPLMEKRDSRDK